MVWEEVKKKKKIGGFGSAVGVWEEAEKKITEN